MVPFDFQLRTRVIFGIGALERLREVTLEHGLTRPLLVADGGVVAAGHADRVSGLLRDAGATPFLFRDFGANPDSAMVEAGRCFAAEQRVDSIVGLGGGSSLDCAKGINFVLSNGGTMRDYWGYGKATRAMVPMIGIPTTAGTGSEAQAYALISDADTHVKMACGDAKAAFRVAILDPALTVSQPPGLTSVVGYDAMSHAVESYVTTKRTPISDVFARDAWRLLAANYRGVLAEPGDLDARASMLLGAHEAGIAIDQSMLGATHACANPLTARHGAAHGVAVAVMLPHVVRWNAVAVSSRYADLLDSAGLDAGDAPGATLAARLDELARAGALPATLRELGVARGDLPLLAEDAAKQWTGTFNPRPFDAKGALELYETAY